MTEVLGLFCGGPALYRGGVPKPLQPVGGLTLLEQFLAHGRFRQPDAIVLLCDESHRKDFEAIAGSTGEVPVTVLPAPDGSSTFTRLRKFLAEPATMQASLVHLTYPDVFYSGDLDVPAQVRETPRVALTVTSLRSRFPRLITDPYTNRVRSISNHSGYVPANPMHVFGGNVIAQPGVLRTFVETYLTTMDVPAPSLEYEFFGWLINKGVVDAIPLYGEWNQIDSHRDIAQLEAAIIAASSHPSHDRQGPSGEHDLDS